MTAKTEPQLKTESPALPPVQPAASSAAVVETAQLDADLAALAAEARSLTDDIRVGDDLRFKKGKWVKIIGDKDTKVGATTPFAVDMFSFKRGWIKWVDRKPVFKAIARPIDGFVSPARNQFPDRDASRWPRDQKGKPVDPWQENFMIVMRDLGDGRLCTYTTTSWYGSKALGALLNVYVRDQKKHPQLMPVVTLASEIKLSPDYGEIDAPLFKVADWQPFGDGAAPPGMRDLPLPALPISPPQQAQQLLPPPKSLRDDLSDEIPF